MALSLNSVKDTDKYIRLLVYGAPGVGKTTFAAGAPNPVILDYENSSETLRGTKLENVPLAGTRKELADPKNVLDFLRTPNEFDTIIVDSISSMNDTMLMEHMRQQSGRDRHLALFADFRKINNVLKEIFYELITIPKNVVLVAHEDVLVDKESNRTLEVRPLLPPAARHAVERLVNEVYYLEAKSALKGGMERVMYLNSQGKILAKNRSSHSENKVSNPTWSSIFNAT